MELNRLWTRFLKLFSRPFDEPAQVLRHEITPGEPIVRYLFSSNHYAASKGRVKSGAFHPDAHNTTSIFRTLRLQEAAIWQLGDEHAANGRPAPQARADLTVRQVRDVGLDVEPDDPPPRHAVIVDWPKPKDEWKLVSLELAAAATLVLRSGTSV